MPLHFQNDGDDILLGELLSELRRTSRTVTIDSNAVCERRGKLSVWAISTGRNGAESWSGGLIDFSASGVRGVFERTIIVGDVFRVEILAESIAAETRVARCVACRLKDGERFEAEFRFFTGF